MADHHHFPHDLPNAVELAGRPTADANVMNDGETLETFEARQKILKEKHGNGNGAGMPLAVRALMAGYPTPNVPNGGRQPAGGMSPTGITPDGKKRQVGTEQIAVLCGWPVAKATDGDKGARTPQGAQRELETRRSIDLPTAAVLLAGWPTTAAQNAEKAGMPPETRKGHHIGFQDMVRGVILPLFFVPTGRRVVRGVGDGGTWRKGLARGASRARVGMLKGSGNAIVPALAAEFVRAYMDCRA